MKFPYDDYTAEQVEQIEAELGGRWLRLADEYESGFYVTVEVDGKLRSVYATWLPKATGWRHEDD